MHAHVDFYNAKIKASREEDDVDLEIERKPHGPSLRVVLSRDEAAALVDEMILAIAAIDRVACAAAAPAA